MKTRSEIKRKQAFRSGAGVHGKSEKAKRRALKIAMKNEY
jgi:hypothetical protein